MHESTLILILREEVKQTVTQGVDLLLSLVAGILVFTLTYTLLLFFGLPEMETTLVAFACLVAVLFISRILALSQRVRYVTSSLEQDDLSVPRFEVLPLTRPSPTRPSTRDNASATRSKGYIFWRGAVLQRSRAKQGLTQEALAEKAGVSKDYISQIESGTKKGSYHVLERILEALGMEPLQLEYETRQRMEDISRSSRFEDRFSTQEGLRRRLRMIIESPTALGSHIRSDYKHIAAHVEILNVVVRIVVEYDEAAQSLIEEVAITVTEDERLLIWRLVERSVHRDRRKAEKFRAALDSLKGVLSPERHEQLQQDLQRAIEHGLGESGTHRPGYA